LKPPAEGTQYHSSIFFVKNPAFRHKLSSGLPDLHLANAEKHFFGTLGLHTKKKNFSKNELMPL
jgi:hypothetical protein